MTGISIFTDTNPLIYLLDGNSEIARILDGKIVWVSVISELELFGKKDSALMIYSRLTYC
jgi:predicted nucleic acid-binding protein